MAESEPSKEMFRLIFPGNILPGTDHDEVVFELARLLKTSPDRAIRLVAGKRRYVKRAFPYDRADKLRVQVLELGVECELEPIKGGSAAKKDGSRRKKHFSKPDSIAMQAANATTDVDERNLSEQAYSDKMAAFEKHASAERSQQPQQSEQSKKSHKDKPISFDEAIMSFNDELEDESNNSAVSGDKQRLAQFVGDNYDHYLKVFDKFLSGGVPHFVFSWHWPAFFVPFFWAIYRKLWLWAAVILVSLVLLPIVSNLVWGALANYIYFRHSNSVIKKTRKRIASSELDETLRNRGGTSTLALSASILIILLSMNGLYWTNALSPVFSELSENLENIEQQKAPTR